MLPRDLDILAQDSSSLLHEYRHFELPPNVRFVGTLNMDETAQGLSPKVIDRSFFIEFEKGNSTPQKADETDAYYPISEFFEDMQIEVPSATKEEGVFAVLKNENERFRHYAHQMYTMAKSIGISDDDFADVIVLTKVLPRIKQIKDFAFYNDKPGFKRSNDRFKRFEQYGDDNQFCDYWRSK